MKVIIAGGRNFRDYHFLRSKCDFFLSNATDIEIVSGAQVTIDKDTGEKYGADFLGECYAENNNYPIKKFDADWDKHGKAAGPIRNENMVKYVSPDGCAIVFWDGKSRGSKSMIELAKKYSLKLRIVRYA